MFKNTWSKWKKLSIKAGDFQAKIVLTAFYFSALAPFAIIIKLFSNPLNIKKANPKWHDRDKSEENKINMKDQY